MFEQKCSRKSLTAKMNLCGLKSSNYESKLAKIKLLVFIRNSGY